MCALSLRTFLIVSLQTFKPKSDLIVFKLFDEFDSSRTILRFSRPETLDVFGFLLIVAKSVGFFKKLQIT